jgi:hypothetical protein
MNLGRIRRLEQLGFKWTIRGLRKQSKSVANTPPLNTSPKASSPRTGTLELLFKNMNLLVISLFSK